MDTLPPTLRDLLYADNPQAITNEIAEATIETIRVLHSLSLSHGYLHLGNLIAQDNSTVHPIDLDNIRKTKPRQHKDNSRFVDAVELGNPKELLLEKMQSIHLKDGFKQDRLGAVCAS